MPDPTVRDMLLAKVDDLTGCMTALLEEVRPVTEQLHPERALSCRNAITMASLMVDETRLRARPLDEPNPAETPGRIARPSPSGRGGSAYSPQLVG